jgi:signal transduction histidine kinase
MSADEPRPRPAGWRRGLFVRVFATFVGAVLAFAALAAVVAALASRARPGADWVDAVDAAVDAREADLVAARDDPDALERALAGLASELELRLALRDKQGRHLAGDPDTFAARNLRPRQLRRLERGGPAVLRDKDGGPVLLFAIGDVGVLVADTGDRISRRTREAVVGGVLLLVLLGVSAWSLARSLTRRLARLEDGAARIARGELGFRVPAPPDGDEVDRLALAMNDMAKQLGELLRGQRALLANVSHELRTPIARMRVLAELLAERAAALPDPEHPAAARLRRGADELEADLREMEVLVQDLLTSGRLELSGPHAPAVQRTRIELAPLLARAAAPYDAAVAVADDLTLGGDPLLLGRMLHNLLSNARRACPEGQVTVSARRHGDTVELAVEDEGPGIAPAERARVFEAFYRLDEARARDRGGVGLGLYLCSQIARAHGGTIAAEDRPGGALGARLVARLPAVV